MKTKEQARLSRPNPKIPIDDAMEEVVREIAAEIIRDPAALEMLPSPVASVAHRVLRRRTPETSCLYALMLAEAVEAALADASVRFVLKQENLHVGR